MHKALYNTQKFGEMLPSYLKSVSDTNPQPVSWEYLHQVITTSNSLRSITQQARRFYQAGDKGNYAQYKSRGGAITPAAQMRGGHKAEHVVGLTAAVMIDLDHIPDDKMQQARQAVMTDPHTLLCHVTASGQGLRILARYTSPQPQVAYCDAWLMANNYYALATQCDYDRATKDVSRLSFLAYDPEAVLNLQCTPFVVESAGEKPSAEELSDPFALAERIADSKGIAYAEGGRHHCLLYRTALLNKMGVPHCEALGYVRPLAPRGEGEAADIVDYVYSRNASEHGQWKQQPQHGRRNADPVPAADDNGNGQPQRKSILASDIESYLADHTRMRFNTISQRMEMWNDSAQRFENFTDSQLNSLWRDIEQHFGRKVGVSDVRNVIYSDSTPPFNPVQDYFDSLDPWQPGDPDYIGQLAATVQTTSDPRFFDECFRKWLVAVFAPLLGSSAPNHTILVLVGPQGRYKSTFCEFLLPDELRAYFKCKTNQGRMSKDDRLDLSSHILIEIAELDSMDERELNQLKALTTAQSIDERAPYAHVAENRPHICSFCATGNNKQFLTDLTGNRRFLPFEVEHILSPREHPFDYRHIYAQVLHLLQNNFQYWFDADDPRMAEHCSQFMEPLPEEELLLCYFRKPDKTNGVPECGEWLSAAEILERCNAHSRLLLSGRKLARIMQKHGFKAHRAARGAVYNVVIRDAEEVEQQRRSQP